MTSAGRWARLLPWVGVLIAVVGIVLMACSGPLSRTRTDVRQLMALPVHVDWLLLTGMATIIVGGLLVQFTWHDHRGG
jgi:hypothetical protein